MTFTSCNTDDLEKDIDALKDRVTSFETQVQQLNDEMNMIRVLLDGNKTITDYSINGDTYTLTLSNGEKLTLTPGVTGGNYPSIEIGENGNWFIAGKDTGLRAEAENGTDATITPKFKIEANPADGGKKYWYVSYDEGATWAVLENGLAEANGPNTSTNPISGATVEGDNLKVIFNGQDYFIPIIKGLECAINLPEGVTDGLWAVAGGGNSSFTVKVNLAEGDLVRVKAPADWNAKLSTYATGATEVTVTVTPPSTPSECVIVVEVTHGVNAATDQIKAKTTTDSYWAEYQAGFDIKIGNVVINKYDNPGAVLLLDGETVPAKGIYFITENATVNRNGGVADLILIAEKKAKNHSPKLLTNGVVSLGTAKSTVPGLMCKGITLHCEGAGTYWFNTAATAIVDRLYFDDCKFELLADVSFSYFNQAASEITDILIESCYFSIPVTLTKDKVINLLAFNVGSYGELTIRNNVFYCNTANQPVFFAMLTGNGTITDGVLIRNNTGLNILSNHGSSGSGYVRSSVKKEWIIDNNLFWYNIDYIPSSNNGDLGTLMNAAESGIDKANFANNKIFTTVENTKIKWSYLRTPPAGFTENAITVSTESPFVDNSLNSTEGKYILKPEYQGIGATIE